MRLISCGGLVVSCVLAVSILKVSVRSVLLVRTVAVLLKVMR